MRAGLSRGAINIDVLIWWAEGGGAESIMGSFSLSEVIRGGGNSAASGARKSGVDSIRRRHLRGIRARRRGNQARYRRRGRRHRVEAASRASRSS